MGIEPTSEPWGLVNVPTSLPRGQTNLRPELAFLTVPAVFQPTTQPTECDVLYDLRGVWQSPRPCMLL
jgi:hypothetical protein